MIKTIVIISAIVACAQCKLLDGQFAPVENLENLENLETGPQPVLTVPKDTAIDNIKPGVDAFPDPLSDEFLAAVIQGVGGTIKVDGVVVRVIDEVFAGGRLNVRTHEDSVLINDSLIYRSNIARQIYPNLNVTRYYVSSFQVKIYRDPIIRYTDNLQGFVMAIVHRDEIIRQKEL